MSAGPTAAVADLRPHADRIAGLARMAPSLHNAQPWSLRVASDHVDVLLDRARLLPVADPAGRQAHLGLGAVVFLVRLALAGVGCDSRLRPPSDGEDPDLVARVSTAGHRLPTAAEERLLAAVEDRRTVRTPFLPGDVPVPLRVAWREAAEREGAGLRWVEGPGERLGVAALVAAAERQQQRDEAYLAELARWTSLETVSEGSGVPPSAFGVSAEAGHAAEFPLRDFAGGRSTDRPRHAGPVEEHPVVAVLETGDDRPEDWLVGGQALMHVLLAAAADGYAASYLNQPLELPAVRQQLRDELRLAGWPQLVLRLGRPAGVLPPQPLRRPVADILLPPR